MTAESIVYREDGYLTYSKVRMLYDCWRVPRV